MANKKKEKKIEAPLTPQEEEFCRLYVKEMYNKTDAYSIAFNEPKRSYARERGCVVSQKPKVKARIEELQRTIQLKANFTAEDAFREAQVVQEMCLQAHDRKGYMEALNMKISLCGLYAPKQSVQAQVGLNANIPESDIVAVMQNILNGGNQLKLGDGK